MGRNRNKEDIMLEGIPMVLDALAPRSYAPTHNVEPRHVQVSQAVMERVAAVFFWWAPHHLINYCMLARHKQIAYLLNDVFSN